METLKERMKQRREDMQMNNTENTEAENDWAE